MQALELAVNEMDDPISYEINLVIQATRIGLPLDTALVQWSQRIGSKDLDIFVTAVTRALSAIFQSPRIDRA